MDMRKWITEHELQLVFTQMKKQMSSVKETMASITNSSSLVPNSIELQGFMQHNPLENTSIVVSIAPVRPHSYSKSTIPKPQKTKRAHILIINQKQKVNPIVSIIDMTMEGPQTVVMSLIIEEAPPSSSTISPNSHDPSPHTTSTFITLSYTIPFGTLLGTKYMEVYSMVQCFITVPGGSNVTNSIISLLLDLAHSSVKCLQYPNHLLDLLSPLWSYFLKIPLFFLFLFLYQQHHNLKNHCSRPYLTMITQTNVFLVDNPCRDGSLIHPTCNRMISIISRHLSNSVLYKNQWKGIHKFIIIFSLTMSKNNKKLFPLHPNETSSDSTVNNYRKKLNRSLKSESWYGHILLMQSLKPQNTSWLAPQQNVATTSKQHATG